MKKLLFVLALLCASLFLPAQTITALDDSLSQTPAVNAEYFQTLEKLDKIAAQGVRNADLFHDIGVCHFHLGEQGEAVLWFLRALNLDSAHKPSRQNLEYISSSLPSEQEETHEPYLVQLFLGIWNFFSLNRLAIVVLILAVLTTLSLQLLFFYPPQKERGLPVLAVMICVILLLVSGIALGVKNHRHRHNSKAVVLREAELKTQAKNGKAFRVLSPGTVVETKQNGSATMQVILPDGVGGWLDKKDVELVVPQKIR
ncbi:MAG: hypothetical protein GX135_03095 [Candidatus Cloacimonetes bacterium]|nr:hypothetical protein [Candidatus Cloacimonadota bacterium]